jgi:hypothetical protein
MLFMLTFALLPAINQSIQAAWTTTTPSSADGRSLADQQPQLSSLGSFVFGTFDSNLSSCQPNYPLNGTVFSFCNGEVDGTPGYDYLCSVCEQVVVERLSY